MFLKYFSSFILTLNKEDILLTDKTPSIFSNSLFFTSPSIITFFILGNNYIISKVAHQILTDKSESLVYPFLDKIFLRSKNNSPHVFKNIGDYSVNKIRMIQSVQEDQNEFLDVKNKNDCLRVGKDIWAHLMVSDIGEGDKIRLLKEKTSLSSRDLAVITGINKNKIQRFLR